MNYRVDKSDRRPAYIQLYTQLRSDIESGVYPFGGRLPSKRLLCEECGVSVVTAQHAYSILCDEGYVEARERSGYYVTYRAGDFLSSPSYAETPAPTPHVSGPRRADFPFSVMAKTVRKVLLDYGEDILSRSENSGCFELRDAISRYLKKSSGISVLAEQIIIGSGAEYLYGLIVQLLGRDRVYALEDPSYEKIRKVYAANGVTTDMLPLLHDGLRSESLKSTSATVLHVTPFHSFPSGVTASASKRAEYLEWAKKRNGYIIEDNYDSELTVSHKNEDTLFSRDDTGRVIYLNTFSHTVAPSIRVGYMLLPDALCAEFREKLGFYSCTVPVLEQYVLAQLLQSGDFERHINRVRRRRRREIFG